MTIGQKLKDTIQKVAEAQGITGITSNHFVVEPTDLIHGDYATNIALFGGKVLKKNPKELAESIAKALREVGDAMIADVTVAGPGFVNIRLSPGALTDAMKAERLGWNDALKDRKYIVEYTDPNPFKEFHIGHLMSNTIGESISRLVEASGAETRRACYQGDVGMHVAQAVWSLTKNNPNGGEGATIWDTTAALGRAYADGNFAYRNDENAKQEIIEINKKIYNILDPEPSSEDGYSVFSVESWYKKGRRISLNYFENLYRMLGTKFDHYFFESKTGAFGKELVEKNIGKVFEESEGAVVYKGDESKGLHTRVFINKEGLPTYEAKELGLAKIKHDMYPYDYSIVITANEVNDYFRVLLDAMSKLGNPYDILAADTEHIGHGIMKLPTGKMSSRTGDVITAESMIADVKAKVLEKMSESDVPDKDAVAEMVAIGAIKYSILRQAPGKDIIFELDQATSFEGDSGPYLQYTYARTRQLLKKGEMKGIVPNSERIEHGDLARFLARFGDVVLRAQKDRAPQYVTTYLIQLAQEFNSYYGAHLVVDENDPATSSGRLALVDVVGRTIKAGLWMLGIKAPEMM